MEPNDYPGYSWSQLVIVVDATAVVANSSQFNLSTN